MRWSYCGVDLNHDGIDRKLRQLYVDGAVRQLESETFARMVGYFDVLKVYVRKQVLFLKEGPSQ